VNVPPEKKKGGTKITAMGRSPLKNASGPRGLLEGGDRLFYLEITEVNSVYPEKGVFEIRGVVGTVLGGRS